jgi:hypothetical protein
MMDAKQLLLNEDFHLHRACANGDINEVELIIAAGAVLNLSNKVNLCLCTFTTI